MRSVVRQVFPVLLFFFSTNIFCLDFWDEEPSETLAPKLSQAMTVSELAAQVLMLGFPGDIPGPETESWVRDKMVGGIKIFGWNATSPEAVARSVRLLQADSQKNRFRIPLLVATDQEGGWVRHIKGTTSSTPGNLALGASGLPYDSWKTGYYIGMELREMGVNMNFAPSIDLYTNPQAHVIGPRSFSQDPVQAGVLGAAFIKGLKEAGVIATAKHFPGHGDTPDDSHGKLPVVSDDLATLRTRELVPYRILIKEGLPAIMTGHLAFPKVTGNKIPASLNADLTQKILRDELGFDRMVITDDLYMEGARPDGWTPGDTAQHALAAGNDMLLISQPANNQTGSWNALVSAARQDPVFLKKMREAVARILLVKLEYLKGAKAIPLYPQADKLVLPNPEGRDFFFQQAARSASLLRKGDLPWAKDGNGLLVVTPYDSFFQVVARKFPGARKLEYDYDFFASEKNFSQNMLEQASRAKKILFNLVTPGSEGYLKALEPFKDKLVVVSLLSPVYLKDTPWVRSAIAVYGLNQDCFEAAVSVIAGEFPARGRVPFRFDSFPWQDGLP